MLVVYGPCFHLLLEQRVPTTEWLPGKCFTLIPNKTCDLAMITWSPITNCWGCFFSLLLELVNNYELENVIIIAFNSNAIY